ncbi:hypothetical protein [Methylobacterium radiodurans]|uniref:hypothetical protein n=1 Tax=Methylobacterium radiodurans TaxID=2202828 RepID=UPI0013A539B5|nr:hypothetical protein [Methylobacterium radiodurans]
MLLDRHGGPCRTDDAEAWFDEIAIHIVLSCQPHTAEVVAREWCSRYIPDMPQNWIVATLEQVRQIPPSYTSLAIGRRLNLTAVEKARLGLTHIAATDLTPEQVLDAHRERDRLRKEARRRAEGRQSQARSASRLKPWIEAGFNTRRTWERHGKPTPGPHSNACRNFVLGTYGGNVEDQIATPLA